MTALPPHGFTPAGDVTVAYECAEPAHLKAPVATRMLRGLRYQHAVEDAVFRWGASRAGTHVVAGPWYRFTGSGAPGVWRYIQPDIVAEPGADSGLLVVLEAKLTLNALAWWQLVHLYAPVIAKAHNRRVHGGIVCGSFDPEVRNRTRGALGLTAREPDDWLDMLARGESDADDSWPLADLVPVLRWKRPGRD